MGELARYILVDHFHPAIDSALLLAAGLFVSVPVVKYRLGFVQWLPLALMRLVIRMMGRSNDLLRTSLVIWLFNSSAMFLYMAAGFHPLLPKVLGLWTGLNIGVVLAHSHRETRDGGGSLHPPGADPDAWRPPRPVAAVCGVAVLVLELPCFFYAIALGMRMGADVAWGGVAYADAFPRRALAYGAIIVPVLLISAIAESVAIRGAVPEESDA